MQGGDLQNMFDPSPSLERQLSQDDGRVKRVSSWASSPFPKRVATDPTLHSAPLTQRRPRPFPLFEDVLVLPKASTPTAPEDNNYCIVCSFGRHNGQISILLQEAESGSAHRSQAVPNHHFRVHGKIPGSDIKKKKTIRTNIGPSVKHSCPSTTRSVWPCGAVSKVQQP